MTPVGVTQVQTPHEAKHLLSVPPLTALPNERFFPVSADSVPGLLRAVLGQMKKHEECASFLLLLDWFAIVPVRFVACQVLYKQPECESLVVHVPRAVKYLADKLQVRTFAQLGQQLAERHCSLAQLRHEPICRFVCTEFLLGFCGCFG